MSVCASANPFNSRPVTSSSSSSSVGRRQALANDERWVALNKNIFQDILNAILIQTTFSSAASAAGKRHISTRPDVAGSHSPSSSSSAAAPSPLSFTTSDTSVTQNPISGGGFKEDSSKDANHQTAFQSTLYDVISAKNEAPEEIGDNGFPCEAVALLSGRRSVGERESFSGRRNGRHSAPQEGKGQSLKKMSGNSTTEIGKEGSKGIGSEIVCSASLRDNMSSAFSKVVGGGGGVYDRTSILQDSHLSVYCEETYVGNVPMMIIGLRRPYHHLPSDAHLSCLMDPPTNQLSPLLHSNNVLKKCPPTTTQISPSSDPQTLKGQRSSSANSSLLLLTEDGRRDQQNDRSAKMTEDDNDQQLQMNARGGGRVTAKSRQKLLRSMYYSQHHSDNALQPNPDRKSSADEVPSNYESTASRTNKALTAGKDLGRKSSRDHSILTILGLLSSPEEDDDKQSSGLRRSGGGEASESTGLEKNRLLGIGVTVIGRSRWMAVDKCIVYDMIDQVLNGERDYFTTTDDDSLYSPTPSTATDASSRPKTSLVSPQMDRCCGVFADGLVRKRAHHLPRTQRSGSAVMAPRLISATNHHEGKRKVECGIEGDLKQNHDMDLIPSSSSSSSSCSSSSSFVSPTSKMSSSQEGPMNIKPVRSICESPATAAKDRLLSSSKSLLEGVSVLRSLLSDDPIEVCQGVPSSQRSPTLQEGPSSNGGPSPQGGPKTTEAMTPHHPPTNALGDDVTEDDVKISGDRVRADDFSKMATDDLRRVKRSRHNSVADGKKRRVNGAVGRPSMTNQVPASPDDGSITSLRSCSVPASSAASTMPDRAASRSFNAIKWKSSMLMRMRTEEGVENDEEGN